MGASGGGLTGIIINYTFGKEDFYGSCDIYKFSYRNNLLCGVRARIIHVSFPVRAPVLFLRENAAASADRFVVCLETETDRRGRRREERGEF